MNFAIYWNKKQWGVCVKDLEEYFKPITIKDVRALFEGKDCSGKKRRIVDLVYEMASTPSLIGLDFADIELIVRHNSKFEFLEGRLKKFLENPSEISKADSVILVMRVDKETTLGEITSVVEKLFSEKQDVVWTAIVSKTEKRKGKFNPKIEMVLGFKP